MKFCKYLLFLFVFTTVFYSCDDEPVDPSILSQNSGEDTPDNLADFFGPQITTSITGRVFNESNQPLSGVLVSFGNETAFTDEKGVFSFVDATAYERLAYVKATRQGFVEASRSITPKEGVNLVEIMMLNMTPVASINSGEESTVVLTNGTSIIFDGNFVNQQGASYTGQIDVFLKHLDPSNEDINKQMPGMLLGQTSSGAVRVLETYGMMAVELRGATGEELQLADGSTAQLTLPIVNGATNSPNTIPLWYFDEVNGYWKEEGEATRQGNTYVGNVTHFSFWNWDYPYPSVYVCINLVDGDGAPLAYTPVNLYSPALNSIGTYGFTNNEGQECGLVPQDDQMFLVIPNFDCNDGNFSTLIGPFETDENITIVVEELGIVDSNFIAQFRDCEGNAITNGYIEISLSIDDESYIFPITNGNISLNANYCSLDASFSFQAVNLDTNETSEVITGSFINPTTDIGVVELCTQGASSISAVDDYMDGIEITSGIGATNVLNVLENDILNGVAVNATDVTITVLTDAFAINADGSVDVFENTPTGEYSGEYQICETANPNNCSTALVTLFVTNTDDSGNELIATDDDALNIFGTPQNTEVLNVLDNDFLNGSPLGADDVSITFNNIDNDYLALETDGGLILQLEFAPSGDYSFEYTICETANPNNCDSALVNVTITNTLEVSDDNLDNIDGTNVATAILDVYANDLLNGQAINPIWAVTITELSNSSDYFVLNTNDGTIDQVIANAPAGTYTIVYQICENFTNSPNSNCDTATVQITVE
ncbi:carboxypeptidase-like regulatory domain-containing protein [Corallibacter sp.]|uniref:carboxypeptidase-like regulatory domain-containing protein n=1 Tax=Corallibacter sp. TaxID=2038084 RepID=UPI003AB39EC0